MIALRDNLPLVQLGGGQVVAFEQEWLIRSLATAARKAGYKQWWLSQHVAESVTHYLRSQNDLLVLPAENLEKAVQSVLQVIGYSEVGRYFLVGKPIPQISVLELALEAGSGYELAFFELLGRRLHELLQEQHPHFQISGLEPAVKLLRGRKIWSRDCDILRSEIVAFTREQAGLAATDREISFSLL